MIQAFRTASPARQLLLIALAGLTLCAILAALWWTFIRTDYDPLYRDLAEADAATIVAELERSHIPYRLADGGHTILVPAGAVDLTRLHVAGQDLPLQGTVGFELFNNSSIGLTEFAQRINLQRALQGELARTIMRIDGIEAARVHLSLGEQTAFRGDRRPPRASVALRTRPGRRLTSTTVRGIQRLVAGSVPDLDLASVVVINDRGAVVSGDAPAATDNPEERNVERFFEERIRRAVETRYPPEAVDVTVWAALGSNADPSAAAAAPRDPGGTGRDYRLRATVAIAVPLNDSARAQVTQLARDAIGFKASLGDTVSVTPSVPLPTNDAWDETPADTGPAANMIDTPVAPSKASPAWFDGLLTPLLLLAMLGVIVLLWHRRARPVGRMDERERLDFAGRLKALLAQRDHDVAPAE
jgi:flagellar M-ring protein FliF